LKATPVAQSGLEKRQGGLEAHAVTIAPAPVIHLIRSADVINPAVHFAVSGAGLHAWFG